MKNTTASYEIGLDREITAGQEIYYVNMLASVGFTEDGDAVEVEIISCEIEAPEGGGVPWEPEGRAIQKVVAEGLPTLTEAIDNALWEEIRQFSEDNAHDIIRDVESARDDHYL